MSAVREGESGVVGGGGGTEGDPSQFPSQFEQADAGPKRRVRPNTFVAPVAAGKEGG